MNEWVSVKDRLPEYYREVLVHVNGCIYLAMLFDQRMINEPDYWCDHSGQLGKVTHWMPLPDAPKEK